MLKLLIIGIGGFAGAIARYLTAGSIQRLAHGALFPYGTFVVNILGCLIIGLLAGLVEARDMFRPETRALVLVGFLGSFTTFSTFCNETMALVRDGQMLPALANIGFSVAAGLIAVFIGYATAQQI